MKLIRLVYKLASNVSEEADVFTHLTVLVDQKNIIRYNNGYKGVIFMLYPPDMTKEDIAEFEAEYNEWLAEETTIAAREREYLANNAVELSEEVYSPY